MLVRFEGTWGVLFTSELGTQHRCRRSHERLPGRVQQGASRDLLLSFLLIFHRQLRREKSAYEAAGKLTSPEFCRAFG